MVDLRLFLMRQLLEVSQAAAELAASLLAVAERGATALMPGYTHMRQATGRLSASSKKR